MERLEFQGKVIQVKNFAGVWHKLTHAKHVSELSERDIDSLEYWLGPEWTQHLGSTVKD
jgi:hypothetical protein